MKELSTASGAIPAEFRDINVVTTEIRTLKRQAQRMVLEYAVEIGKRLTEAKAMLPHGEWAGWLNDEVDFSQDKAERLMKIYAEWDTISNSAALRNSSVTNALRLLALSNEDREEVIKNNDVENLSTRELEKVIAERNAEKEAKEAAEKARDATEKQLRDTEEKLKAAERDNSFADAAKAKAEELQTQLNLIAKERDKLKEKAAEAESKAKQAEGEIVQLKNRKAEIPKEEIDKIREEARGTAEKEYSERMAGREKELEKAKEEAERLRKQLAQADTEVTVFKTYFEQVQNDFQKLGCSLTKIKAASPETAEKLKAALKAMLSGFEGKI